MPPIPQQDHAPGINTALAYLKACECNGLRGVRVENAQYTGLQNAPRMEFQDAPFIPRSKVQELVNNTEMLRGILCALYPGGHTIDLKALKKLCPKVLCILLRIGKAEMIGLFLKDLELQDSKLPFGLQQPQRFPPSTDPDFYKSFCQEQHVFCAVEFAQGMNWSFAPDRILPIIAMKSIKPGVSSTIRKIEVHNDYDHLVPSDFGNQTSGVARSYVLKTYKSRNARKYYENEINAFRKTSRQGKINKNMIELHGSYEYHGTYNLILAFANKGTLEEYFQKVRPPTEGHEIIAFWQSFFGIVEGLCRIHEVDTGNAMPSGPGPLFFYQGMHQDIKPSNILVDGRDDGTPFEWTFKLADFGLSHFKQVTNLRPEVEDRDARGTRIYGAPECYRANSFEQQSHWNITSACDIWSLGCLLSEAVVWMVKDYQGLTKYRTQRRDYHVRDSTFLDPGCFHDGDKVLQAVLDEHRSCRRSKRECDPVTKPLLDAVEEMLEPCEYRPTARALHRKLQKILNNAIEKEHSRQSLNKSPMTPPSHSPIAGYEHPFPASRWDIESEQAKLRRSIPIPSSISPESPRSYQTPPLSVVTEALLSYQHENLTTINKQSLDLSDDAVSSNYSSGEDESTIPNTWVTSVSNGLDESKLAKTHSLKLQNYGSVTEEPMLDVDTHSIVSDDESIGSSVDTADPSGVKTQAAQCLVDIFKCDEELSSLYSKTSWSHPSFKQERFIRNHRRLMKHFFLDVQLETQKPPDQLVVRFLRSTARQTQISHLICQSHNTMVLDLEEKADKMKSLNDFLGQNSNEFNETSVYSPLPETLDTTSSSYVSDVDTSSSDNESENDAAPESAYSNIQAAAQFLTSSKAFAAYKLRLRRYANGLPPVPQAFCQAIDNLEANEAEILFEQDPVYILRDVQYKLEYQRLGRSLTARHFVEVLMEQRSWEIADQDLAMFWSRLVSRIPSSASSRRVCSLIRSWRPKTTSVLGSKIRKLLECFSARTCDLWLEEGEFAKVYYFFRHPQHTISKLMRPAVPAGFQRIEWTCTCGDSLYGDYKFHSNGSMQHFRSKLSRMSNALANTASAPGNDPQNVQLPPAARTRNASAGFAATSNHQMLSPTQSTSSDIQLNKRQDHLQGKQDVRGLRRFYICVRSGRYCTSLGEIETSSIRSDDELFRKIAETYEQTRWIQETIKRPIMSRLTKTLWNMGFRRLKEAHLVKFLNDQPFVDVTPKKPSVPPVQYFEDGSYWHKEAPQPMKEPPMSSDSFLHYLTKPSDAHKTEWWGPSFPLKAGESLLRSGKPRTPGWGVEIEEGPNLTLLNILMIFGILISGVGTFLWGNFNKDGEDKPDWGSAFTLGGDIVATEAVVLSSAFFAWM